MIKHLSMEERYHKAKTHLLDALHNKAPRPIYYSNTLSTPYYILDYIQSSLIWDWLIFLLSYSFMYLVVLDAEHYALKIGLESAILLVFFFDTFMDFYTLSFDHFKRKNKYPSIYFWKLGLFLLMVIDLIVFIAYPARNGRPIRPFRIFRARTFSFTQSPRPFSTPKCGKPSLPCLRSTRTLWSTSCTTP